MTFTQKIYKVYYIEVLKKKNIYRFQHMQKRPQVQHVGHVKSLPNKVERDFFCQIQNQNKTIIKILALI